MYACGSMAGAARAIARAILYGGFMLGMIAGWILLLVTLWRAMRAHETLAAAVKKLADQPAKQ